MCDRILLISFGPFLRSLAKAMRLIKIKLTGCMRPSPRNPRQWQPSVWMASTSVASDGSRRTHVGENSKCGPAGSRPTEPTTSHESHHDFSFGAFIFVGVRACVCGCGPFGQRSSSFLWSPNKIQLIVHISQISIFGYTDVSTESQIK